MSLKSEGQQWVKHYINLYVDHCLSHCLSHCLDHHPEPRSGLCPELLADFRIPKPPGCSQGAFWGVLFTSCGCGVLAVGEGVGVHPCILHEIRLGTKLKGREKVKGGNGSISASISTSLIASLICLAHCLAHHPEPRSGLCPELLADFRIPKPPGCSQGAQRAVFCAVRVADFLAEGAGWGASPGRGGELGCQAKKVIAALEFELKLLDQVEVSAVWIPH